MMVEPFRPEHLAQLNAQAAQLSHAAQPERLLALARGGFAFTGRAAADGPALICGGAMQVHTGYATLWSLLSAEAGPFMLGITRRVRQFVRTLPHRRVDMMVSPDHEAGVRWAGLLGFRYEAFLAGALEDGGDAMFYRWEG